MSVPAYQINGPGGNVGGTDLNAVPEPIDNIDDPIVWLARLEKRLLTRRHPINLFESYYDGSQPLAFATEQFRQAFGNTFRAFSDNWMQIVVDAVEERLNVQGFRIPADDAEDLTTGDADAWDMWQANDLDVGSQLVHTNALVDSIAYVLVGPGGEYPVITGESALQVITESRPGNPKDRLAGLKRWKDDTTGYLYATVYLPDGAYKFISESKLRTNQVNVKWVPRQVEGEDWPVANRAGVVPIVAFPNRPRLLTEGASEIEQLIPLQNAINKLFLDMLVASEFTGFRQRWATGVELPVDPETGQPINTLKMAMDRFLNVPSNDAQFGTLDASDLSNYTNAIAMAIQHLASRSSTPPHYFLAHQGNFPSGEALKAAETGLVSKVRRRMRHFGEGWEEVIRLAFLMIGEDDKAKDARGAETIWGDPESRTESEHIDAVVKMAALGVPTEVLWEKSGWFSPQEINRMKKLQAAGAPTALPPGDIGTQPPQDK